MMVRRPSTFGELISLRRTMDRVFDDPFFHTVPLTRGQRRMPLDVIDTADSILLEAALPGVRPEDIEVSVLDDVLTVTAGTDGEGTSETAGYQVREVRRGRVTRTVTLPHGLRTDEATATFENGLLRLAIPKAQTVERRVDPHHGAGSSGRGSHDRRVHGCGVGPSHRSCGHNVNNPHGRLTLSHGTSAGGVGPTSSGSEPPGLRHQRGRGVGAGPSPHPPHLRGRGPAVPCPHQHQHPALLRE